MSAAGSVYVLEPPLPIARDAAGTAFSAERAAAHVRTIAAAPRPVGSPEHGQVERYIVGELQSMGLAPQVQIAGGDGTASSRLSDRQARNIAARIGSRIGARAVLLCAHYDSVRGSPGAGDNAAAVSSLLETARLITSGPPLRNDVIVLFTDAEEVDGSGARAFVDENPWAKDVDVVLNFDARGNSGPVLMFETSPGNGALIAALRKAVRRPLASSLFPEAYRLMPSTTDFSVFRARGFHGLNFANIGGVRSYHSMADRPASLDARTLQHVGSCALELTRYLGNVALPLEHDGDAAYFNVVGPWLVTYPVRWTVPIVALAIAVYLMALFAKLDGAAGAWARVGIGALAFPLNATLAIGVGRLGTMAWMESGRTLGTADLFMCGLVAATLALGFSVDAWVFGRVSTVSVALGNLLWCAVASALLASYAPGAAYLTWVPLLLGVVTVAASVTARPRSPIVITTLSLTGGLTLAIVTPVLWLIYTGLMLPAAAPVLLLMALLVGTLVPQLRTIAGARRSILPIVTIGASVLLVTAAFLTTDARVTP